MASKTTQEKLEAKIAAREKLGGEIAELKVQLAQEKKAAKQRQERRLGRLVMAAGLDQFSVDELKAAFEKLEKELHAESQNGRHPSDAMASEDDSVKPVALSET